MKILLVVRASCYLNSNLDDLIGDVKDGEDIIVVLLSLIYNKCATELESGYYRCQSEFYLPGGGLEIASYSTVLISLMTKTGQIQIAGSIYPILRSDEASMKYSRLDSMLKTIWDQGCPSIITNIRICILGQLPTRGGRFASSRSEILNKPPPPY